MDAAHPNADTNSNADTDTDADAETGDSRFVGGRVAFWNQDIFSNYNAR